MQREHVDVVVVGASLAGCTAAILYARAGLSVALLETHRDPDHYKRACTHFIQSSAVPTIRRLGLAEEIEAVGGRRNRLHLWTRWGWIRPTPADHGYNIRRQLLDPLLRRAAAAEEGVRLLSGHRVTALLHDGYRWSGVVAQGEHGPRVLAADLVVGADGRHSTVAGLAGLPSVTHEHGRFMYFAAFEDVALSVPDASQLWLLDPDVVYAFRNDLTVLSVMPTREKLAAFRADVDRSFRDVLETLPDGPDLSRARRVTPYSGVTSYAGLHRRPTAPGLALVGDAALSADYLWGTGCGWAFQTAEWLVEATTGPLQAGVGLGLGLRQYATRRALRLTGHRMVMADAASGRPLNAAERLILGSAAQDERCADRLRRYSERTVGPIELFNPAALARAVTVRARGRRPAQPAAAPAASVRPELAA